MNEKINESDIVEHIEKESDVVMNEPEWKYIAELLKEREHAATCYRQRRYGGLSEAYSSQGKHSESEEALKGAFEQKRTTCQHTVGNILSAT